MHHNNENTQNYVLGTQTGNYPPGTTAETLLLLRDSENLPLLCAAAKTGHYPAGTKVRHLEIANSPTNRVSALHLALEHHTLPAGTTLAQMQEVYIDESCTALHTALYYGNVLDCTTQEQLEKIHDNETYETAWSICCKNPQHNLPTLTKYPPDTYDTDTAYRICDAIAKHDTAAALNWLTTSTQFHDLPDKSAYFTGTQTGNYPPHAERFLPFLTHNNQTLAQAAALTGQYPPNTTLALLDYTFSEEPTEETIPPSSGLYLAIRYNHLPPNTDFNAIQHTKAWHTINCEQFTHDYDFPMVPAPYVQGVFTGHYPTNTTAKDLEQFKLLYLAVHTNKYPPNTTFADLHTGGRLEFSAGELAIQMGHLPPNTTKADLENTERYCTMLHGSAWHYCITEHPNENTEFLFQYPANNYPIATAINIATRVAKDTTKTSEAAQWLAAAISQKLDQTHTSDIRR